MELEIKNKREKGLTLVEMLVGMVVFSIIITSITNIAFYVIKGQKKAFAIQTTQESGRFLLEFMAKEIRTSSINTGGGSGLTVLNITNSDSETFNYQFDNTNKRLIRNNQIISSDNVEITGGFYVQEYSFPADPARKVVTITMKIETSGNKAEEATIINLQNTIAPRAY